MYLVTYLDGTESEHETEAAVERVIEARGGRFVRDAGKVAGDDGPPTLVLCWHVPADVVAAEALAAIRAEGRQPDVVYQLHPEALGLLRVLAGLGTVTGTRAEDGGRIVLRLEPSVTWDGRSEVPLAEVLKNYREFLEPLTPQAC